MTLPAVSRRARRGFTLVEIMVATALVLLLMAIVVQIFADVGRNIRNSRTALESNDRQRSAQRRLMHDLAGVTCPMRPPLNPDDGWGYFEYLEGPIGPVFAASTVAQYDAINNGVMAPDTSIGDFDDILMYTARSRGEPFVGRFTYKRSPVGTETPDGTDAVGTYKFAATTIQSEVAEIAWFVRGTTLYRRVLLVRPDGLPDFDIRTAAVDPLPVTAGFYGYFDLSVHTIGGIYDRDPARATQAVQIVPNTLGDLTKRENRFAHQPFTYPHEVRHWGSLGLPTLRECSDPSWPFPYVGAGTYELHGSDVYGSSDPKSVLIIPRSSGGTTRIMLTEEGSSGTPVYYNYQAITSTPADHLADFLALTPSSTTAVFDAWRTPLPWLQTDATTGTLQEFTAGTRVAEDVVLTNVIGFDVKVYDPFAPIIADSAGAVYTPGDANYVTYLNNVPGTYTAIGNGAYVDLNYLRANADGDTDGLPDLPSVASGNASYSSIALAAQSYFRGPGAPFPLNAATLCALRGCPPGTAQPIAATYDTWSTHYEMDGVNQDGDGVTDEYTDGFDNAVGGTIMNNAAGLGNNGVDDATEQEAPPPYPVRLRGIQVKIRVFDPDSQQIREVTVTHSFQDG